MECKARGMVIAWVIFFTILFVFCGSVFSDEPEADSRNFSIKKILKKADEARGNREGISWKVSIAVLDSTNNSDMVFNVNAKGYDLLAESLAPAKDKGNKILMVNGNMWFYKPGLSKPVPISQRQKLSGNAAYGDIAATNYEEDYEATVMPDETINQELCHVFFLKAKTNRATYDQIKYWISKPTGLGLKAEYYTVSGKKFKVAEMTYENHVQVGDQIQPFISEIRIDDVVMTRKITVLTLENPKMKKISNYIFNRNMLKN